MTNMKWSSQIKYERVSRGQGEGNKQCWAGFSSHVKTFEPFPRANMGCEFEGIGA